MTTPPLWIRPARGERYRISDQHEYAAEAWRLLTGNTSATYGELVALARLGAEVRVKVESWRADEKPWVIMRMDHLGALRPVE